MPGPPRFRKAAGMTRYDDLPYRPCVGVMLINKDGLAFIGRRAGGAEHVDDSPCLADAARRRRSR